MIVLTSVHLLSLAATLLVILAITAWSARSVRTADGFSLCGRSAGTLLISGGIAATCIGGSATIGTAQMAYAIGLSGWWFTLGMGLGLIVLACFYAVPLRRSGLETLPQYLAMHYGPAAGPLASVVSSLGTLFSAVASGLSGIALVSVAFGLSAWQSAAVLVVLVAAVVFGGLKGAGVSGLLKLLILWATMCIGGAVAVAHLWQSGAVFPAFPWFSMAGRGMADCVGNAVSLLIGMLCTQSYIQAVYSAADVKVARKGVLLAAGFTIPLGLPSVAIGMFMHVAHPDIAPIMALPMFFALHQPAWLGGIGLAGILFSVVGSIAGLMLGIGTMVARDIGAGVLGITDGRRILLLNRASIFVVTCFSLWVAIANADTYVLDWNYMSMALRGGGIVIPMTLAVFCGRRLPGRWAVWSMAASTAAALLGRFAFHSAINPLFVGLSTSAALVCVGLVATRSGFQGPPALGGSPGQSGAKLR